MCFLQDIIQLFYPKMCVTCSEMLLYSERIICTYCGFGLPIIDVKDFQKNKVASSFYGRIPIKKAVSFLYFNKKGKTRKLIHQLKYKGRQEIGGFLGQWFGYQLQKSGRFNDIDFIVPVPLYSKRFRERGYNQLTLFGKSLSKMLKTTYKPNVLLRVYSSKTQTYKGKIERFSNVNIKFELIDTSIFENKHILLIDDVITTGATLEACCRELLKTKNITISIATMAYTQ